MTAVDINPTTIGFFTAAVGATTLLIKAAEIVWARAREDGTNTSATQHANDAAAASDRKAEKANTNSIDALEKIGRLESRVNVLENTHTDEKVGKLETRVSVLENGHGDLKKDNAELKTQLGEMKRELKADISDMKTDLKSDIHGQFKVMLEFLSASTGRRSE